MRVVIMRRDPAHTVSPGRADVDETREGHVGGHDAPGSWLDRWREQEPVRLYLWSVATAVLAGCVLAGWLTRELALAVAGPVAAALMVGGTAAARGQAFAPATVDALQAGWEQHTDELLEEQHSQSWQAGWDAGVAAAERAAAETERTPEKVAWELATAEHPAPPTAALTAQAPCTYVEHDANGARRCTLPRHPGTFPHQLEALGGQE
jgi:hypothetical protein